MVRVLTLIFAIIAMAFYFWHREPNLEAVVLSKAEPQAQRPLDHGAQNGLLGTSDQMRSTTTAPSTGLVRDFEKNAIGLSKMSGAELLALYKSGLNSENIEEKFLANQALGLCIHTTYTSQALNLSKASAGEQIRASESRQEMRRICGPFATVRLQEALLDAKNFASVLETADSPFSSHSLSATATEPQKQAFDSKLEQNIKTYGAASLLWESGNIADWMISRSPNLLIQGDRFVDTDERKKVNGAVNLAMCFSGYDCSSSSLTYMNLCARSGECGTTINEGILSHFSNTDRAYVEDLARKIGTALLNKDLQSLKTWYAK